MTRNSHSSKTNKSSGTQSSQKPGPSSKFQDSSDTQVDQKLPSNSQDPSDTQVDQKHSQNPPDSQIDQKPSSNSKRQGPWGISVEHAQKNSITITEKPNYKTLEEYCLEQGLKYTPATDCQGWPGLPYGESIKSFDFWGVRPQNQQGFVNRIAAGAGYHQGTLDSFKLSVNRLIDATVAITGANAFLSGFAFKKRFVITANHLNSCTEFSVTASIDLRIGPIQKMAVHIVDTLGDLAILKLLPGEPDFAISLELDDIIEYTPSTVAGAAGVNTAVLNVSYVKHSLPCFVSALHKTMESNSMEPSVLVAYDTYESAYSTMMGPNTKTCAQGVSTKNKAGNIFYHTITGQPGLSGSPIALDLAQAGDTAKVVAVFKGTDLQSDNTYMNTGSGFHAAFYDSLKNL